MLQFCKSIYRYLFYTRTCIFQLFYLFFFAFFHGYMISNAAPFAYKLYPNYNHIIIPLTLSGINLIIFIVASNSNPGIITADNIKKFANLYEYDHRIYERNKKCPTCLFVKPARSKHCSISNRCIYRFDHYCIWICNAVGGNNIRLFILFLYTLCVAFFSGIYNVWKALYCIVVTENLWSKKVVLNGVEKEMDYFNLFKILICRYPIICMIGTSSLILFAWVLFFVVDHTLLIISNITTNERHKLNLFFNNREADELKKKLAFSNNDYLDKSLRLDNSKRNKNESCGDNEQNSSNKNQLCGNDLSIQNFKNVKFQDPSFLNIVNTKKKDELTLADYSLNLLTADRFYSIYNRGVIGNIEQVFCPIEYSCT